MRYKSKEIHELTGEELDLAALNVLQGMIDGHNHYEMNRQAFALISAEQERRQSGNNTVN